MTKTLLSAVVTLVTGMFCWLFARQADYAEAWVFGILTGIMLAITVVEFQEEKR